MKTATNAPTTSREAGCTECERTFPVSDTLWKERRGRWVQGRVVMKGGHCPECGETGHLSRDGTPLVERTDTILIRCYLCAEKFEAPADDRPLRVRGVVPELR